jgi:hypothetical protein
LPELGNRAEAADSAKSSAFFIRKQCAESHLFGQARPPSGPQYVEPYGVFPSVFLSTPGSYVIKAPGSSVTGAGSSLFSVAGASPSPEGERE